MIQRFLRLFAAYRELEDAAVEIEDIREAAKRRDVEISLLQDRLDAAIEEKRRIWEQFDKALDGERNALRMQVNFATQQKFGVTPYPDANKLPESLEPDLNMNKVVPRRMMPSEAVAHETTNFINRFREKIAASTPK